MRVCNLYDHFIKTFLMNKNAIRVANTSEYSVYSSSHINTVKWVIYCHMKINGYQNSFCWKCWCCFLCRCWNVKSNLHKFKPFVHNFIRNAVISKSFIENFLKIHENGNTLEREFYYSIIQSRPPGLGMKKRERE